MESVEIGLKKWKLAFVCLALMGLLIPLGMWFLTTGLEATTVGIRPIFLAMGIFLLLIAALSVPVVLMRLANKAPGLIIDEHGLTDHSAALPNGFVAWSDIESIEVAQPERTAMMFIVLLDPEKYLRTRTSIRRAFAKIGDRFGYPSPFGIVVGNLSIEFAELVTLVEQYWGDYRQRENAVKISLEKFRV